jgi:hypothetical protein
LFNESPFIAKQAVVTVEGREASETIDYQIWTEACTPGRLMSCSRRLVFGLAYKRVRERDPLTKFPPCIYVFKVEEEQSSFWTNIHRDINLCLKFMYEGLRWQGLSRTSLTCQRTKSQKCRRVAE